MARAVAITRQPNGTRVEPRSKGWGPHEHPDEWKIVVPLTDTPNPQWMTAWQEGLQSLPKELEDAWWEFKPEQQQIVIWATEDAAPSLIDQFDVMFSRANARCGEIVAEVEQRRRQQAERIDEEQVEAVRLQERLDKL